MNEKMKMLIAYDGSPCAEAALDDLRRAGLPPDAEALVVSVAEVFLPPPPPSSFEIVEAAQDEEQPSPFDFEKSYAQNRQVVEEAHAMAMRAKERLQKNFPEWQISVKACADSPAWGVLKMADNWKPNLLVVGSEGHSALGRLFIGSVSQKVLTEASCSVRVARGRVEVNKSPVRILLGVDGSPGSELAVQAVAARVWPPGSEARVVVADDPLPQSILSSIVSPLRKWVEEGNEGERQWVRTMADAVADKLRGTDLIVSSVVEEGDPKRVVVAEAEEWGADCIFVGSTGFSNRFERFLLGSVSAAVASRAHCSVEVVRGEQQGRVEIASA
jgi:nucleotide-binding universal stress UspA family protein